ncbi:class I SAM-dependent methyltransferase [Candidatus Nitrosotenuis cloacae]|uniref:class I SAM-dependent methyltransferase n=1 Tax=Candidatus Nitrosotenuis cloacae TaxID=1603555 RepID=UPI0022815C67|nr:class I SAM-dependent methyltransferase [Candidatus Nitrosotenuis cloacae]
MGNEDKLTYWNSLYSAKDFFGTGPTKLAKHAESIFYKKNLNILEIGCGQGRDAIFFSTLGHNVHAFDISVNAIDYVKDLKKSLKLENLNVFVHDVEKPLPFPEETFDFIYSNLALQFFDMARLSKIFDNISAVVKKQSLFLLSTKKSGDKYHNFGNKIDENAFEHKGITRYFFNEVELKNLLTKNFEIITFDEDRHINLDSTTSVWWKILTRKI